MNTRRILMADDDAVLREIGAENLLAAGYDVFTVCNGAEAVRAIERQSFDLAIFDFDMPEMTGLDALKTVKGNDYPLNADMPIIMLTGRNSEADVKACYDAGATSYMTKPVNWLNVVNQAAFVLKATDDARAVKRAHEETKERSRIKDVVMMTLRHELRSPLHVIQGFSNLLLDTLGPRLAEDEKQSLEMIDEAVGSISEKLNRLFLYSEILAGSLNIAPTDTSVQRLIKQAVATCEQDAANRKVSLVVENTFEHILEITADEEKLAVCLIEMIDNAIKFSPEGATITIRVSANDEGKTVVTVDDAGPGIDEDEDIDFFAPFKQGDSGLTRASTGLGLGLTVAKSITTLHGAQISLGNQPNGGGRATLVLPADDSTATSAAA